MNRHRKTSGRSLSPSFDKRRGSESSARLPSDYSPPSLKVRGVSERENLQSFSEYQLTVRPTVNLTRYQMSMLLTVLSYEVVNFGIDFTLWLTMEWLFSNLLGSKKVWEIRDEKERQVLTVSNIILLSTNQSWFQLGERTSLPLKITEYLLSENLIISERTYRSRVDFWYAERFLEVRAVRLDLYFERSVNSIRYSSYCKGYGESSRMGRRQKTRPSSELDGEDTDRPETVIPLMEIPHLLYLNLLEIQKKYKHR